MRIHMFAIDLMPLGDLTSTGGGLRSLQILKGIQDCGVDVTYSLPMDNDAVRANWDRISAEERELAFSRTKAGRKPLDILRKIRPDAALYLWPNLFTMTRSSSETWINIVDANGLQNVEAYLIEFRDRLNTVSFAGETNKYLNKILSADMVISGSREQKAYFSAAFSLKRDSLSSFEMIDIPYQPSERPQAIKYDIGAPNLYITGSFLPWNLPGNFLAQAASILRLKGKGKLIIVGKANPVLDFAKDINFELRELKRQGLADVIESMSYKDYSNLINGNGIAIDLHARTVERELAIPIRTVTFLAHGVPVITGDYSNLSDEIRRYDAGWCIDPTDSAMFQDLLEKVIDEGNQEAISKKSENARNLVSERLDANYGFRSLIKNLEKKVDAKKKKTSGSISRGFSIFSKKPEAPVVLICTDDLENFLSLRVRIPFDAMYRRGLIAGYVVMSRGDIVKKVGDPVRLGTINVVWAQRGVMSCLDFLTENLRGKFNLDIDDNLLATPSYRQPFSESWMEAIKALMDQAATITSTTPRLIDALQRISGIQLEHKAFFAPNLTDSVTPRRFNAAPEAVLLAFSDRIPLTVSRANFFRAINIFCKSRGLPVVYIGTDDNRFHELDVDCYATGFLDYNEYKSMLRNENVVAIAPLEAHADSDTQEFIDSKSDIKMVEFASVGTPGVFGNAAPYLDSLIEAGPIVDCNDVKAIVEGLEVASDDADRIAKRANESVLSLRLADEVVEQTWAQSLDTARLPTGMSLELIQSLIKKTGGMQAGKGSPISEDAFNPTDYLAMNRDIEPLLESSGLTPYQHYLRKGFAEGRLWMPGTNPNDFLTVSAVRQFVSVELEQINQLENKVRSRLS